MIDFNKRKQDIEQNITLKTTTKGATSSNIQFLKSIGLKVINNGKHIRIKHKRLL